MISTSFELFLDLDGVFADFDGRVFHLTGKQPHEMTGSQMWKAIYRDDDFFLNLELMKDALHLWEYVKQYKPKFLTGAPSSPRAREHKKQWVAKNFGSEWEVIVLPRRDKCLHSGPGKVLVDDRYDNLSPWILAGGHGVLHTDPHDTVNKLEELRLAS